ncbi:LysM peptidoglycan-binding domain-containing protein [Roseivirga seohaensis]|uniref:LysM peptidoglycan-binding domain-containing protein n=1 Tax=Roseivirga seohaensis TaxID=1914963 RepID=UPI0009EC21CD|nr:LysM peptidoglycan-binding domain-containing protein [Roseivirga seohaensis]
MVKYIASIIIFLMASLSIFAQAPMVVPSEMEFAGVKLKITNSAKKEIEETLDLLTRSQYHFQLLVDRSNLYMGMVEEVLKKEGIPDDFKYLAIQEGQFISDAVSTSNAVGFWQFKKASAQELGLRVDGVVDERKHIIASTVGATKYFKRSNFVFDNWLWTMQSYLQGLGGAQRSIPEKDYGAKKVEIDGKTHWYLKKYIAHKLAFQDYVGRGRKNPELQLATYEGRGKTLRDVSREVNVDLEELKNLNKWLVGTRIPDEKSYKVIYPVKLGSRPIAQNTEEPKREEVKKTTQSSQAGVTKQPTKESNSNRSTYSGVRPVEGNIGIFPRITGNIASAYEPDQIEMNGIDAIRARSNDNVKTLASRVGKSESKIRKYNDLGDNSRLKSGAYYYVKNKKNRGKVHYHIVQPGETLWSISQDYGIKYKKLLQKNRMREAEQLKVGRVLWLRFIRPANIPIEYTDVILPDDPTPEDKMIKEVTPPEQPIKKQTQIIPEKKVKVEEEETVEEIEMAITKKALIATSSDTIITHVVQPKESFFAISQKYGIELDDIIDWNGLNVMDGLQINQELRLVVPKAYFLKKTDLKPTATVREIYHEVEKGETLWGISRKYGVTIENILKWNNKTDNNLDLGERLKILQDN